jgi:hypothetical protein
VLGLTRVKNYISRHVEVGYRKTCGSNWLCIHLANNFNYPSRFILPVRCHPGIFKIEAMGSGNVNFCVCPSNNC